MPFIASEQIFGRVNEPKRMKLEVTRSIMNGYFVEQNKVNDCEALEPLGSGI